MKATDCIGDHAETSKKNRGNKTKKPITLLTPSYQGGKQSTLEIIIKKMHFMAVPHYMCTSTLKGVTPTSLFADSLGDNEDSVWMGFPRSWAGFIWAIQFSVLELIKILLRICDDIFIWFYIFLPSLEEKKWEKIAGESKITGANIVHNFLERSTYPGTSCICQKSIYKFYRKSIAFQLLMWLWCPVLA